MPSRVRIIAKHSVYGLTKGGRAIHAIEDWYKQQWEGYPLLTPEIKAMPRWKRVLWMVKGNKNWIVRVFRENRRASSRKSLYGLELIKLGYRILPLKKYKRRHQEDANGNIGLAAAPPGQVNNWLQVAVQPVVQQVNPVQIVHNNGRIFEYIPEPEEF